jgi:hypothetical protein
MIATTRARVLAACFANSRVLAACFANSRVLAACFATAVTACAPPAPRYPTRLEAPGRYPGAYLLRQHVTVRVGEGGGSLDVVVQKRGDELVLLGLTPLGTRAFLLRQRGLAVEHEHYAGPELPFPPVFVLYDVHRALLRPPLPGSGPGLRRAPPGEELHEERWTAEGLAERTFRRSDGEPRGVVRIEYAPPWAPGTLAPAQVTIDNPWAGYHLRVETYEAVDLEASEGDAP